MDPLGPFIPHSEKQITPKDWECIDGTLYVNLEGKLRMTGSSLKKTEVTE